MDAPISSSAARAARRGGALSPVFWLALALLGLGLLLGGVLAAALADCDLQVAGGLLALASFFVADGTRAAGARRLRLGIAAARASRHAVRSARRRMAAALADLARASARSIRLCARASAPPPRVRRRVLAALPLAPRLLPRPASARA
ncbi:MAG TPA: hypothetical protein PLB67_17295 [Candidatus Hydrogenedentes bacterium]|nr:hypothetical protein [Candidatus Hydrogenedentota bacterium]